MQVVRTETEIARVENWAVEGIDERITSSETAPCRAVAGAWRLRPDEQP